MSATDLVIHQPDADDWAAYRDCVDDATQDCAYADCTSYVRSLPEQEWRSRLERLTGHGHTAVAATAPDGTWVAFLAAYLDSDGRRTYAIVRHLVARRLRPRAVEREAVLRQMWDHVERWAGACGAAEVVLELHPDDEDHPDILRGRGYAPSGRLRPSLGEGSYEVEWVKALRLPHRPVPVDAGGRVAALS